LINRHSVDYVDNQIASSNGDDCYALQVLNVINFAEAPLLADNPAMADAQVMVHLTSHVQVRTTAVAAL